MNISPDAVPSQVWELLEAVCEDRLTAADAQRLEKYVLTNPVVRDLYVDYLTLHGTLHWDAATLPETLLQLPAEVESRTTPSLSSSVEEFSSSVERSRLTSSGRPKWAYRLALIISACFLVSLGAWLQGVFFPGDSTEKRGEVAVSTSPESKSSLSSQKKRASKPNGRISKGNSTNRNIGIGIAKQPRRNIVPKTDKRKIRRPVVARRPPPRPFAVPAGGSTDDAVIAFIDDRLEQRWREEMVKPSAIAVDGPWLRRVSLDVIGRIPTAEEVETFRQDPDPGKRRMLVERLLDDPRYVRNWTTVWSNLLVGQSPNRDVDKPALEKFLRDGFRRNRPWNEIVFDLIAAEGDSRENGATNFLIAHLNNQAVPATAITARLFLGTQIQCTQCHSHPFNNWKQNQFWELNGFFQQTKKVRRKPASGKRRGRIALVNRKVGGPIYYATRSDLLMAAFPKFEGKQADPRPTVNRRAELVRFLRESKNHQLARAMVNRTWAQFFGYGFTRPIDDMGPHNPPTHPELLERLTAEFVNSGYDLKRLIRWICNSRAYQLSSRFNNSNGDDNPSAGLLPLFSRMYVKQMTAAQLYDSLLVATRADRAAASNWQETQRQRQEWMKQFVIAYHTEENDEATTFDGTIPQALLLMNSPLVRAALSGKPGTYFHTVLNRPGSDVSKVRRLSLAALSRLPTAAETAAFRRILNRPGRSNRPRRTRNVATLQDIFWAFLNSNEFILIH